MATREIPLHVQLFLGESLLRQRLALLKSTIDMFNEHFSKCSTETKECTDLRKKLLKVSDLSGINGIMNILYQIKTIKPTERQYRDVIRATNAHSNDICKRINLYIDGINLFMKNKCFKKRSTCPSMRDWMNDLKIQLSKLDNINTYVSCGKKFSNIFN